MDRRGNGNGVRSARWYLVVKPEQRDLLEILRERLHGSGVEVVVERRSRERRRGSFGPAMDRRQNDRRRLRPVAFLSAASLAEGAPPVPAGSAGRAEAARSQEGAVTHPCPTCASAIELEMPRFPHPPARVEMEVAHVTAGSRDPQHYVEIAAFTVSGRLILSQRVPGRRPI
jgi:hypothetical protein